MKSERVIVIGSGLAGLSAACTLAARGYKVTVIEKNSWAGGKAAQLNQDGFRFDMGPTILLMPSVLRKVFCEAGKKLEDYLTLIKLDPQWRCFYDDGTQLDLVEDIPAMTHKLRQTYGQSDADGYLKFMEVSQQLHKVSDKFFFWKSVGSIADTMNMKESFSLEVLKDVMSLRFGRTVAGLVRQHVPDHRVSQMIDHFTQYVGSAPSASPAVLCGIAHMQTSEGIWYPLGGTRAVPEALIKLAQELHVEFVLNEQVEQILLEGKTIKGVKLQSGKMIDADFVISNSDSVRTHQELLPEPIKQRFLKRRNYEPACSGVVLYLGLKKRYEQLLHHNFIFSMNPEVEFDEIYKKGIPAADPTCYVCAPAMCEAAVAPDGGEALYILVHTPYLRPGQNWKQMLPKYRHTILNKIKQTANMHDLEENIVTEAALTPQDIHDRYHVLDGAIYGLASHGRFMGAFKPANRSPDIPGLYLAGGAAHPGPGMPMVLMSGWIAADTLCLDQAKGKRNSA